MQERIAAELDANGLLAKPQAPGPFSSSTTPSQPENNNNKKSGMFHAIFGSSHTAPSSAETQAPTGSPDGFQNGCTKMSAPAVGQSGAAGNGAAVGVEGGSGSGVASWPLPRQLGMEDLQRLPYLTATIKEAMRVLPVVSVMSRWGVGAMAACMPHRFFRLPCICLSYQTFCQSCLACRTVCSPACL